MTKSFTHIAALTLVLAGLSHVANAKPAEKKAPVAVTAPVAPAAPAAKAAAELDINSATEAELIALPGVGEAYAKKIIAGRPYDRKDQLVSKNVLPEGVYTKVKSGVIAKQAAGATGAHVKTDASKSAPAVPSQPAMPAPSKK